MKKNKYIITILFAMVSILLCSCGDKDLTFNSKKHSINGITFSIPEDYKWDDTDNFAVKQIDDSSNYLSFESFVGDLINVDKYNSVAFSNWKMINKEEKKISNINFQIFEWELDSSPLPDSHSEKYNDNKGFSCYFNAGNYFYVVTMLYKDNNFKHDDFIKILEKISFSDNFLDTNVLSEEELNQAYSSPDDYKGKRVKISGKIFSEVEYNEDNIVFQMYADAENSEKNTIVVGLKNDLNLSENDYVIIEGVIEGSFTGDNSFGGSIEALQLAAINIQKSSYKEVISPAKKTLKINKTIKQYGYSVALKKIEFSAKETRLYFKIKNNGTDVFNFYDFDIKIIQGKKQYGEQSNYDADYKSLQSELIKGAETEGVVTFPPLNQNQAFEIHCEGSSENWDEEFEPFVFKINASGKFES